MGSTPVPTRRLTPAKQQLILGKFPQRMLQKIAGRYSRLYPHYAEDFKAAGLLGLTIAASRFDPQRKSPKTGKPVQFMSFATWHIRGSIQQFLREIRNYDRTTGTAPNEISLQTMIGRQDGRPLRLADIMPAGELPVGWEQESIDTVMALTAKLPFQQQQDVRRLFTEARFDTRMKIARHRGVFQQAVGQSVEKGLRKIRKEIKCTSKECTSRASSNTTRSTRQRNRA